MSKGEPAPREKPDVVITDIRMPPTNTNEGLLAAQRIRAEQPGIGVLVLSQYVETRQAVNLLEDSPRGVGYLLKDRVFDIAEFADTVRRIARGGPAVAPEVLAHLLQRQDRGAVPSLTAREQNILSLMVRRAAPTGLSCGWRPQVVRYPVLLLKGWLSCRSPRARRAKSSSR